ncbi:sugar transferase [bacterium]|uniref:Multidrug MFS transporter n=2 Tax=Candidatus Roizmaniibacteriota TaxID=1752723 RepID=A0A2M7UBT5_9BACT|nr:sugar transferase [bacterium]NCO89012.1 sugar transferase [Candidatus Roizmanbacteria bacterium]PIQ72264.1 MAG: multidrug MFS transporter [Candidatus Roizmanbacteria bacterium CG11_big_fil_rev_8_21_14_0_20_35_14]PIZ68629.1 MAG: multidrug MFS transporter [Candidatus Roizmanbacteria bacterium CG_4_10_14_0_2_um_filter_36_35]
MIIDQIFAVVILLITLPLWIVFYFLIKLTSPGFFLFKQKRSGKDKKPFFIYKFRTMVENAEDLKSKIYNLNEANGPVFKIHNDPRYTKFGRLLAHSGLDELPQLINVIKGDMAFVGPRPLPVNEAKKVPKKYERRFSILPGMTSLWVIRGADHSSFKKWMKDDLEYIKNKSFWYDLKIIILTVWMLLLKKSLDKHKITLLKFIHEQK